jgi:hypothetical protein
LVITLSGGNNMNTPRRKIPFFILIVFILLLSAASSPNAQARWHIESIDAPRLFKDLTASTIKVVDGTPSFAVGGDHLYYFQMDPDTSIWSITRVDSNPGVGAYASLARDSYGSTFISYYDSYNSTLKFATPSTDIFRPGWVVQTIDAAPGSGEGSAINALVGGQPHISYLAGSDIYYVLRYTRRSCTGSYPLIVCSWSTPEQVDSSVYHSANTSIAVDSTGIPHIGYVNLAGQLRHAYRIGEGSGNCGDDSNWQCETVPGLIGLTWYSPSLALWNDLPRIAFHDTSKGLSFAYKDGTGWHISLPRAGIDTYGINPSLVLDAAGIPHISYAINPDSVMWAYGSTVTGGAWTNGSIPGTNDASWTAISYNTSPSAYPCILYYGQTYGQLRYTCKSTSWTAPQMLAISMDVGRDTSLALDMVGVPHIAYADRLSSIGFPQVATWSQAPGGCYLNDATDQWKCEEVNSLDSNAGSGYMNSIAINPLTGSPAVSYLDRTGVHALGYAWYVGSGGNCTGNDSWNCTIIDRDATTMPGYAPSLAFNSSGSPVIAYETWDSIPSLKLAHYVGPGLGNCNMDDDWSCEMVAYDIQTDNGYPSLGLTSTGTAVITYGNHQKLWLALQVASGGSGCFNSTLPGTWNCSIVDNYVGYTVRSSLIMLSDSETIVSYGTGMGLGFATISIPSGTPVVESVYNSFGVRYVSMDTFQGVPWIAYADNTTKPLLRLAHRVGSGNGNCGTDTAWYCEVLDDAGSVGQFPSLKINSAGMAYISYYDISNGDLKLAYTRLFSFMPLLQNP